MRAEHAGVRSAAVLAVLLGELALAATRVHPGRTVTVSGRFSWSMFAGPLTSRCSHTLSAKNRAGAAVNLSSMPAPPAMTALLSAATAPRFATVAPWFAPYADDDADVARGLDDVLARWHASECPQLELASTLRCASPLAPPFERTRRWPPR